MACPVGVLPPSQSPVRPTPRDAVVLEFNDQLGALAICFSVLEMPVALSL